MATTSVMRSSHIFITYLIIATVVQLAFCFNSTDYSNHAQLSDEYNIYWTVVTNQTDGDYIKLALSVKTNGWIGFGIAEPTSGSMPGSDILVAYVINGTTYVEDRYATAFATPSKDACNDWILISGQEKDNITTVEVRRKLNTNDTAQDRPIQSGSNRIIYAWGTSDSFEYHGTHRNAQSITFYGGSTTTTTLTNVTSVTLLNSVVVPSQPTTYMCTAHPVSNFALPANWSLTNDMHIVQFSAIINTSYVHHFIVHACSNASWASYVGNTSMCYSPLVNVESECQVAWVWTPGSNVWTLPKNVGYRFGPSTGITYFVVETHYSNYQLASNITDHSGLQLTFTQNLREHDLGIMSLGDVAVSAPSIPPNKTSYSYEFSCPSQCTSRWGTNITIIASLEHMHMSGSRIWTSMWKNNSNTNYLGELERVDYYNFDYQTWNEVNHVVSPGDRFNVHCVYDTSYRVNMTNFGAGSMDEMCMNFIAYYPLIDFKMCGYFRNMTVCGDVMDALQITNPVNTDPTIYNDRTFGVENKNGCGTSSTSTSSSSSSTTGESTTTSESSESESDSSLGEVTGAGGIVALIAIISGLGILGGWYYNKRKKEERAKLEAQQADIEVPIATKRNEQGVIRLEESGYYEDEK